MASRSGRIATAVARAARPVLGRVPLRHRFIGVTRVVNLVARALWEIALRRAPSGTLSGSRLASGAQVELDLSERIQGQVALTGVYEPTLVEAIVESLPNDGVFFDVGGNVGLVTFEVAGRMRGREPQIHVFEPHPGNVAALRRNLELNPSARVLIEGAAVGARSGSAVLGQSPRRNESGWHRIVSEGDEGPPVAGTITVPVVTVDEYAERHRIEHVHVLKVDVEGMESAVLEGARGLLSRGAVDVVILEVSEPFLEATGGDARELYETMARFGYRPSPIESTSPTRMIPKTRHLAPEDVAFRRN